MRYETELKYTVPLLRSAVFAYWRRSVGIGLPIAVLLVAADLTYQLYRGDRSWVVGALAAIVAMAVVFVSALFLVHYGNALRKLRDMGPPHARFVADDSFFTVESSLGTSTFQWSLIAEIWRFPTFWLLLFSKAHFMTVPSVDVSPEMREFVREQVRKAGGKIS